MSLTVEQWKAHTELDIRRNIHKYLNIGAPSIASSLEANLKGASFQDLGKAVEVRFASDDKIQQYLDGQHATLNICCLACIRGPFGLEQCAFPHNGPCNMC